MAASYANDISSWKANYPGGPAPVSNRTHCITFSDWASQPKTELANGMRMDGNYYDWPGSWVKHRPGFMTGSGMPMRFADTNGTMIDVYQAATQMTDESDQTTRATINTLLDNALGSARLLRGVHRQLPHRRLQPSRRAMRWWHRPRRATCRSSAASR